MTTRFKKQLPANCYIDRGRYVEFRKQIKGVKHQYPLGKVGDGLTAILERYHAVIELIEKRVKPNTLGWLSERFQDSRKFKALSKYTRPRYVTASKVLEHVGKNGRTLAEMPLNQITKPMMQKIMELRLAEYKERGLKGESAVNYEVAYLSSMISWGLNFETEMNITVNPLLKLEKIKAPKNERYVTHQEYWAQYNKSPALLQAFYEVQYLCACRSIEVRELRESDDLGDKLLIRRTKGSKHTYINMSDRLRLAIDKAKALRPKQQIVVMGEDRTLFCNKNGERIKQEGLKSAMGRIKAKMGSSYWSLHLLKSKGLSDAKDKDMAGLTEQMKKRYDKQIGSHDAVE